MTILAYFADILYTDGMRDEKWLTVDERNALIGDGRIAAVTYIPAVRQSDDGWLNAPAWLIENIEPGPFVTDKSNAAMSAWQLGGTVTPLQFATQPTENA